MLDVDVDLKVRMLCQHCAGDGAQMMRTELIGSCNPQAA